MPESVRYIIDERGERIGVLLDLDVYQRLANPLARLCRLFSRFECLGIARGAQIVSCLW